MTVRLVSNAELLDEVVVTGYGVQRKASFTGAATVVGEDVLAKKTDVNFVKALEGAVPGIQMNNSTSMPGVWGSIYIRGRGSLNSGTQPLYVIDGMPINSDTDAMSTSDNNMLDPMSSLNPADIESITVLKDASATAIYGSRAANGVIVVTTKKGSEGKFNLNLDIKQGFVGMANNNMDFASAQESMNLFADGYTARYGGDWQENYDYLADEYFGWDRHSSYDWMDAITRKGYYQDYNLNAQGRTGNTGYYVSLGYLNTEGLVLGSDMERFTGRLNLDTKFKWATLGVNTSYSYSDQNSFSLSTGGAMSSPITAAISSMTPMYPFYDEDGNYANINMYNPLALTDEDAGELNQVTLQTINLNPYLQVDFGKGIYARTTLGVNISDGRQYQYWSAIYNPQAMDYNGLGQQYNYRNTVITWNNILGWNYTFADKHDVNVMVGQEMQKKSYFYEYYAKSDFPFAAQGMRDLTTAGSEEGSEYYKSEARLASYFLDAHYSYADKYYLSGSYRRDGSSVFGADNRWGNFWSVGAKWRLSGEDFLSENKVITNAAIRASYGTVGNQDIDWYAARGFYTSGANYNDTPGMRPGSISNPELTWEHSDMLNIGLDAKLLNSRLNFTGEYYIKNTKDILLAVPVPLEYGFGNPNMNVGQVRNKGWELSLSWSDRVNDFGYSISANLSDNRNEVIDLGDTGPWKGSNTYTEVGLPFNSIYGYESMGLFQSDDEVANAPFQNSKTGAGDIRYKDQNNDNKVDANDRVVLGDPNPHFLYGLNLAFDYKNFDLSMFFQGIGQKDRIVMDNFVRPLNDATIFEHQLDYWTPQNTDAKYPRILNKSDANHNYETSDYWMINAGYLRMKNLTFGYTIPRKLLSSTGFSRVRVYFTANNLFTISDFVPGMDPEASSAWAYPFCRTYSFGLNVQF